MTVIGITGPSGAGKGKASEILKNKYGFSVIDADNVYHSLVSRPSECVDEIRHHFGESVIDTQDALDRAALRKLVFGEENRERLLLLNSITHKHVIMEIQHILSSIEKSASVCIIDAPLLIESGLCSVCDFTISILADKSTRAQRIAARDSIDIDDAMLRINSQKDDEYYIQNTSHYVKNNSDEIYLGEALCKILSERRVIF